jgi:hypothetical protein
MVHLPASSAARSWRKDKLSPLCVLLAGPCGEHEQAELTGGAAGLPAAPAAVCQGGLGVKYEVNHCTLTHAVHTHVTGV